MKVINSYLRKFTSSSSKYASLTINPFRQKYMGIFKLQTFPFAKAKQASVLQQYVTKKIGRDTEKDKEKISAKLLCELIGSKYYPSNDEIILDPYTVVTVYDDRDKLIGHMNLIDAKQQAKELKKDVVLRNDHVKPPIVKIMKYKIVLLKRLIKKLSAQDKPDGAIQEEREKSTKFMLLNVNISKNDLIHKISKMKDYLTHFTNLRVAVRLQSEEESHVFRVNNLLKNLAKDLNEFALVKTPPTAEIARKLIEREDFEVLKRDPTIYSSLSPEEIKIQQQEVKDASFQLSKVAPEITKEIESYEAFGATQIVYTEFESLLIDASGIDFEKLLESVNVDDLLSARGEAISGKIELAKTAISSESESAKDKSREEKKSPKEKVLKEEPKKTIEEVQKEAEDMLKQGKPNLGKHKLISGEPEPDPKTKPKKGKEINFIDKIKDQMQMAQLHQEIFLEEKHILLKQMKLPILRYTLELNGKSLEDYKVEKTDKKDKKDKKKKKK